MTTECEKRVKTKCWKQKIGDDSHLLFIPYSLASISLPAYLRVSRDADVAWKTRTFLSLLSRAVSLAFSFLQTPWRFSCLISQLTLRNTHCRFCSNRCEPVIYDDSCLNRPLCRGFWADNARFHQEMLFEIIALFRISAWSATMFSNEKNPASSLWQRRNTLIIIRVCNL